jgi:hypothetical protein
MKKKFLIFLLLLGLYLSPTVQSEDLSPVWLESDNPKIKIELLMNYGDSAKGQQNYPMVGIGDGLGIYKQQDKVVILMNHELKANQGRVRRHGEKGAFVSKWFLTEQGIIHGEDLIQNIALYDRDKLQYKMETTVFEKLCSADLAPASALWVKKKGKSYGTTARIFFSGEEISTKKYKRHGRAFAHVVDGGFAGISFELPKFGHMSFENIVLNPYPQQLTIAFLLDDSTSNFHDIPINTEARKAIHRKPPSELYIYIGHKLEQAGNPVDAADLNNGQLYGIKVDGMKQENRSKAIAPQTRFKLIPLDKVVKDEYGAELQLQSIYKGISQFLHVEDGVWNLQKNKQNEFFFVTPDKYEGNTRLYKLVFDDIANPLQGGTLTVLLNGNEHGIKKMDNITADSWGRLLIQEDPGQDDPQHLAKIWLYDLNTSKLHQLAQFKAQYFLPHIKNKGFISSDEETSGIIPAFDTLGEGWYIFNAQSHRKHINPEIVESGQLLRMFVPKKLPK